MFERLRKRLSRSSHRPILPVGPSGEWWAGLILPEELIARARALDMDDVGHGYDRFGMSREGVAFAVAAVEVLYSHYFRVLSHGHENIPEDGPVVLACNHGGTLPLDGLMVCADVFRHGPLGRVPRTVVDHFAPLLPWVNLLFSRAGAVGGSRGNFHALLEDGQMILVYPEGVPGIAKPFSDRYKLQRFRAGHAEMAILHQAKIVPMCVVGAEEQWPTILKLNLHLFGSPYIPIPVTPIPLPVRYHLWYGEAIDVPARFSPDQSRDPALVQELADEVQARVAELIAHGLAQRPGVFA
jgi:1-acyl-sn-glycerol-3-phosphate acyltransferase